MYSETLVEAKDYVTLTLPPVQQESRPTSFPTVLFYSSRSLKRKWNQLPRLQRVLIGMVAGIMVVFVLIVVASPQPPFQRHPLPASEGPPPLPVQRGRPPDQETPRDADPIQSIDRERWRKPEEKSVQNTRDEAQERVNGQDQIPAPLQRNERQESVVKAMRHAWKGYKRFAWGFDHLLPLSAAGNDWLHLGLTLVDALDTLWIMDLKDEFNEARDWVEKDLKFNINKDVNLFETTIRVLGGLLAAYHLSNDHMFLDKAVDLGDRLMGAFESNSGVPFSDVNLFTGQPSKPKWGPDSSTSEVSTIQLEFRDLSRLTGNPKYAEKVNHVMEHLHKLKKLDGLVPIFINAHTGEFRPHSTITLGARGDSYYEYLLKQWIQMGKTEDDLRDDYTEAVSGMEFHLGRRTKKNNLFFFAEMHGASRSYVYKMDELTCYLPATLALGVHNGMPPHHLDIAKDLLYTCVQTWLKQPTNLAAEITYFSIGENSEEDFFVKNNDAHYLLRPETIESLWYMYHLTGNTTYQDWGWQMFQGIEKYCRVENGYTSIGNVKNPSATKPRDKMESFFLGETLKYFFLLFADDQRLLSLDKYVFNSEGHPLPIYKE